MLCKMDVEQFVPRTIVKSEESRNNGVHDEAGQKRAQAGQQKKYESSPGARRSGAALWCRGGPSARLGLPDHKHLRRRNRARGGGGIGFRGWMRDRWSGIVAAHVFVV